jgi:hypothetical protein
MKELKVKVGGDTSGFELMMARVNGQAAAMGRSLSSTVAGSIRGVGSTIAAAFSIGAITALTQKTIEYVGHLRDVSDGLRVNTEWLQRRANAAKLAGGSMENLEGFISTMNRSREEAFRDPQSKAAQSFSRLGISSGDITGLSTMDFFDKLVKAYANGAGVQAAADVEEVGGKTARKLLAAFSSGMEGGSTDIVSDDVIDQLDEIGDSFETFKTQVLVGMAPLIYDVTVALASFANWIRTLGAALGGEQAGKTRQYLLEKLSASPDATVRREAKRQLKEFHKSGGVEAYADQQLEDEIKRQQDDAEKKRAAREAKRQARNQLENSPPNFSGSAESDKADKIKEAKAKAAMIHEITMDDLSKVGLFAGGAGIGSMNNIPERQLAAMEKIADETARATAILEESL